LTSSGYAESASSFQFFSRALLLILLVAILAGGGLLMTQGYRSYLDAQRKTTFVSNVSHELKTPLTTIRMYAEMLGEGRVTDETKRHRYLNVIVTESQRLTRLVNNVLDFSRLEQRRKKYQQMALDIHEWVRGVVQAQTPRFEEAGMGLTYVEGAGSSAVAYADRDAVEQVLLNLLDNASKYAASGKTVEIRVTCDEDHVRVVVSDRGPGVPRAHVSRIFESFHRVDDTLTARHPGAGLGLSIGRRLLRDMGGDLRYADRPGGGAEFVMLLMREVRDGQA